MSDTKFILVVEDDPILKNLLGHTMAGKYQTLYASDGNEALALFEQNKPSLVLLDLMLPTMDGFTVLEAIRKRPDSFGKVPVIVVSNLGQQKDKDRALALGANEYLIKAEVPIEDIVTKIESLLGSAPVGAPVEPATPQTAAPMASGAPLETLTVQTPLVVPEAPAVVVPDMSQPTIAPTPPLTTPDTPPPFPPTTI